MTYALTLHVAYSAYVLHHHFVGKLRIHIALPNNKLEFTKANIINNNIDKHDGALDILYPYFVAILLYFKLF